MNMSTSDHTMPPNLNCSGSLQPHGGGTWIGHVLPGSLFFVWGQWLLFNVMYQYIFVLNQKGKQMDLKVENRVWYPLGKDCPAEPMLKFLLAILGIPSELIWFHTNFKYSRMRCGVGTKLSGLFDASSVNNWQHATMYPGFAISGALDLIGTTIKLPQGLQHIVLMLAHSVDYIIMSYHKKHIPMDGRLHQIFSNVVLMTALSLPLELVCPVNFVAGLVRPYLLILQGTWMFAIARTMLENRQIWSTQYAASYSMVTLLFCWHLLAIMIYVILVFLVMTMCQRRGIKKFVHKVGTEDDMEKLAFSRLGRLQQDGRAQHKL